MGAVTHLHPRGQGKPRYLSPAQVCEMVPGLTERKLRGMRENGSGPRYRKPSLKTVVYTEADVLAWVESHVVSTKEQR